MDTLKPPPQWSGEIAAWLDYLRATGRRADTLKLRSYQLRRFAAAHADLGPLEVTFDHLVTWLAGYGQAASTRHSMRSALRSFYGWTVRSGKQDTDPSRYLECESVPIRKHRPAGELTVRRAQRHEDERTRLMVKLASIEGMRAGEISRVHTDDVFEDLLGYSLVVRGKGGKNRIVPLDDELAAELLERPHGWVFPGRIDGHLSGPYVSKLLSRALPDGTTGHMLRHRSAGRFYEGTGYDLRATQEFLGHASPATTQIYTSAEPHQMRRGLRATAG